MESLVCCGMFLIMGDAGFISSTVVSKTLRVYGVCTVLDTSVPASIQRPE